MHNISRCLLLLHSTSKLAFVHCPDDDTVRGSVDQRVFRKHVIKSCPSMKKPQSTLESTPLSDAAVPTWHDGCYCIASPNAGYWGLGWGDPGPRTGRLSGPHQNGLGSSRCVCLSLGNQGLSLKHNSKSLCLNVRQTRSKPAPASSTARLDSFQCCQEYLLPHSNSLPDHASIQQCRLRSDMTNVNCCEAWHHLEPPRKL